MLRASEGGAQARGVAEIGAAHVHAAGAQSLGPARLAHCHGDFNRGRHVEQPFDHWLPELTGCFRSDDCRTFLEIAGARKALPLQTGKLSHPAALILRSAKICRLRACEARVMRNSATHATDNRFSTTIAPT